MLQLALANLRANGLTTALSIMLLSIGVGMVSFIIVISNQLNDRFNRDIRGIDMVVGAKGSPLQLILSAVYQIDDPTGNIPLKEATRIQKHPLVKYSIPLAYGDSYKGHRIIGTDTLYLSHFKAKMAEGNRWNADMEVVLGNTVSQNLNLAVGDRFHGTHGLQKEGETHKEKDYLVVGILQPTGSVADRLILTSVSSVWNIHNHEEEANAAVEHAHSHADSLSQHFGKIHHREAEKKLPREITALLVKFKSPMGMMQLPRFINQKTSMQAALPAIEINRLYSLMGIGFSTMQIIGLVIICIAAISVFISLLNSLKERKYELALMRSLGASPFKLFSLIIQESLLLCLTGYVVGIALGRIGMSVISSVGEQRFHFDISANAVAPVEVWLLPFTLAVGLLAAIIPAFQAYRSDISAILRND